MNYVYIDNCYPARGLLAYFWCVIDVLRTLGEEDKLFVDLSNRSLYYDPGYLDTNNVWEYYFEQPSNLDSSEGCDPIFYDVNRAKKLVFGLKNGRYSIQSDLKVFKMAKKLVEENIRFKPHIISKVDDFVNTNFKEEKILGVHVRGGAHLITGHGKGQSGKLDLKHYFRNINKQFADYTKLFLMTADGGIREIFKSEYGAKLLFFPGVISPGIGKEAEKQNMDKNYLKGETAIIESILLSKCDKMILTGSNLGCFSMTLQEFPNWEIIDSHINYR